MDPLHAALQSFGFDDMLCLNTSALPRRVIKQQADAIYWTTAASGLTMPLLATVIRIVRNSYRWYWIFYIFLAWEIRRLAWKIWWKAPRNVRVVGYPTVLGKYLRAIRMMWDSDTVIQRAYDTANGEPFAIPMVDRYLVMVSDRQQAKRLENCTPTNLSEIEALHELSSRRPNLVLGDVKISSERYFKDGTGALKKHLRSNILAMSQDIRVRVQDAFNAEFEQARVGHKGSIDSRDSEWRRVYLVPTLMRVITRVNLPIFVGNELGGQPEVLNNLMTFFWNCLSTLIVITFVPAFLVPLFGRILMGWGIAKWKLFDTIVGLAQLSVHNEKNGNGRKPTHLVQWVADMMKIRDSVEISKSSIGLVFGSAFQIPMITHATLYQLCMHPQYKAKLRGEAFEHQYKSIDSTNKDMPYMDSFIKETARLSPGLIISVPRRVMSTYTSPDGVIVPEGNWVAIPQYTLMRDPKVWSGGAQFDGDRFVDAEGRSTSRFTHPSFEFPYWGSISHACPARFYAAAIVKTVLIHVLRSYEFKLEKPGIRLFYSFGMIRLTNPFMTLLVRRRNDTSTGVTEEAVQRVPMLWCRN